MKHKIFTLLLAVLASATIARAAVVTGTCGENLTWSLDTKDSTLTITGSGRMDNWNDWDENGEAPWNEYKNYIAKVVFPEGLTYIGSYAFYLYTNIQSIELPASVTRIASWAFGGCHGMKSLTLSQQLDSIDSYAFYNCSTLSSLTIPAAEYIGDDAFYNCCVSKLQLPDELVKISDGAFHSCSYLKIVEIGSAIQKIGEDAFKNTAVERLTVAATTPPSGASCGIDASNCKLYVPEASIDTYKNSVFWEDFKEILAIGTPDPLMAIQVQVRFPKGEPDAGVEVYGSFPDSAVAMTYNSNYNIWWADIQASEMQTFNFREIGNPSNVIRYSTNNGLTWQDLEDMYIGEFVFEQNGQNFISLDFINASGLLTKWTVSSACGDNLKWKIVNDTLIITGKGDMWDYEYGTTPWGQNFTGLVLPDGITRIGNHAFEDCAQFASVTIPSNVTSIGLGAFTDCTGLRTIEWNAKNCPTLVSGDDIYPAFYTIRENITSLTFGADVVTIPDYLCLGMTQLTSVTIPSKVTKSGLSTFNGCTGITSVVWNAADCPTIEEGDNVYPPFYAIREQITEMTIGATVRKIPSYLCYEMSNLASVTIDGNITNIGLAAFYGCPKAVIVIKDETPATLEGYALVSVPTVYVPCGTLSAYQSKWSDYASIIQYPALEVTITGVVEDANQGSVIVPKTICDEAVVTAVPKTGYHFEQWSDGNKDNPRTIDLTADATYEAEFAINTYTLSVTCNLEEGSIEGDNGIFEHGTEHVFKAVPNEGYEFDEWSDGDKQNPRTIILVADTEFTAIFKVAEAVDAINADNKASRTILRDGQLFIIRDGKTYTATGVRVE